MATSISDEVNRSSGQFDGTEDEYNYRSVSRAAVLSVVFGLLGLFSWYFPEVTVLSLAGLVLTLVALRNFKRFPTELSGKPVAIVGGLLSLLMVIASPVRHTYIYYTELPEGYERISFSALKSPMGAPDVPPDSALGLNGKKVFLKGYIHPTSLASNASKTFILVPDWATCCFGQQPPLTHMVEVRLSGDQFANKSFRRHSLAGTLQVRPSIKPIEGLQGVFYELEADHFQ
ncbi:MAG: DUF3299 domain-containing protein [Planctomycetota bacterium]|jgi:hypothetical protein